MKRCLVPMIKHLMPEDIDWLQSDNHDVQALVEQWVGAAHPEAAHPEICDDLSIQATLDGDRQCLDVAAFAEWLRGRDIR